MAIISSSKKIVIEEFANFEIIHEELKDAIVVLIMKIYIGQ